MGLKYEQMLLMEDGWSFGHVFERQKKYMASAAGEMASLLTGALSRLLSSCS